MDPRWGQQEQLLRRCVPPIAGSATKREICSSRASKSWARARRQEPAWASSEAAAWSGAAVSESLTQSLHSSTLCRGAARATITDDQRQLVLQRAPLRADTLCASAVRADALCASALRTKQPQLEQTKP